MELAADDGRPARPSSRRRGARADSERRASVDSQRVKTTATGGKRGYDGGKKVTGRKRHIFVDTQGMLLAVTVTAASVDDAAAVPQLFAQVTPQTVPRLTKVWADSKYHNHALHQWTVQQRPTWSLEVVSRPPGAKGLVLLPKRWVAERTFGWNDLCRRHSKDCERRTDSSEAMVKISSIGLMLRRLAPMVLKLAGLLSFLKNSESGDVISAISALTFGWRFFLGW
jgi:putative transposase